MLKRILVPLDGGESSEAIVPVVAALGAGGGAVVRLLHVAPVPESVIAEDGRTVSYADQETDRVAFQRLRELERVQTELAGVPVERAVRFGDPVEEIVLEAEDFDADLIALVSPRRGRVGRFLIPDVADKVARKAPSPVLVLQG